MNLNSHIDRTRFDANQQTIELGVMGNVFNMNAKPAEAYEKARAEVRRYMADYTNTQNAPSSKKGGWYAVITKETGKVWLAETKNFQSTLNRYRGGLIPKEVEDRRHEGFAIFLATKDIEIEELFFNLDEANCLLGRGIRTNDGTGRLFVINHNSGYYYLTKARRADLNAADVLTRFVGRLLQLRESSHHASNKLLHAFISDNAGDLLRETGFDIREVGKFKDTDEAVEMMNQYYIDQSHLKCLNHVFDKR